MNITGTGGISQPVLSSISRFSFICSLDGQKPTEDARITSIMSRATLLMLTLPVVVMPISRITTRGNIAPPQDFSAFAICSIALLIVQVALLSIFFISACETTCVLFDILYILCIVFNDLYDVSGNIIIIPLTLRALVATERGEDGTAINHLIKLFIKILIFDLRGAEPSRLYNEI
jgi:hypothetical protein